MGVSDRDTITVSDNLDQDNFRIRMDKIDVLEKNNIKKGVLLLAALPFESLKRELLENSVDAQKLLDHGREFDEER